MSESLKIIYVDGKVEDFTTNERGSSLGYGVLSFTDAYGKEYHIFDRNIRRIESTPIGAEHER